MEILARFFKYNHAFRCDTLLDVFAVDLPARKNRFEITYVLLSTKYNTRVYIRLHVSERSAVPSLTKLFLSANWLEREV